MSENREITHQQWIDEATALFGPDPMNWRFVCPSCGYVAKVSDWKDAGATEGQIGYSCIGRVLNEKREAFYDNSPGPCNYAGGGFIKLNPVTVNRDGELTRVFEFDK